MELKAIDQSVALTSDAARQQRMAQREADSGRDDLLGVACSIGCAVHCAAMPILISVVPVFTGNSLLSDPLFHQVLALLCTVFVARSIIPGYLSHKSKATAYSASAGVAILLLTAFVLPHHCTAVGGPALAMAGDQIVVAHQHFSTTLLSTYAMDDWLGVTTAAWVTASVPFFTPIGGLLLIFAHGSNIRLRGCKDRGCRCS